MYSCIICDLYQGCHCTSLFEILEGILIREEMCEGILKGCQGIWEGILRSISEGFFWAVLLLLLWFFDKQKMDW